MLVPKNNNLYQSAYLKMLWKLNAAVHFCSFYMLSTFLSFLQCSKSFGLLICNHSSPHATFSTTATNNVISTNALNLQSKTVDKCSQSISRYSNCINNHSERNFSDSIYITCPFEFIFPSFPANVSNYITTETRSDTND